MSRSVYLGASDALTDDSASGGMIRFFGSWELVGRGTKNSGALVWKVENRHAYDDKPPSNFGLVRVGSLGYVGFIAPPWSDQGSRVSNLYWRQRFNEGRSTFIQTNLPADPPRAHSNRLPAGQIPVDI